MSQRPNLSELERALKSDRAISEGQLLRHHGLTLRDLGKHFSQNQIVIEHSATSTKAHKVTMVSLEPLDEAPYSFRHTAGLAEMRRMLGVAPESWLTERTFEQTINPDAVWQRGAFDRVAIEYDVCAYSVPLINRKLIRFRPFNDQIWGTVSRSRAATLRSHLGDMGVRPEILQAKWW
jgi:hypothetical protein